MESLNRYVYVENNPLSLTDPKGTMDRPAQVLTTMADLNFMHSDENSYFLEGQSPDVITDTTVVIASNEPPPENGEQESATGRQPDGSYVAATGPGSEISKIDRAADRGTPVPLVGSGECVALTSHLTGVTDHTPSWERGPRVVNDDGTLNTAVKPGTAVATFDKNGKYPSGDVPKNSGTFLGPGVASGKGSIRLMDQWNAHPPNPANPPQSRDVRFNADAGRDVSNNSNAYYVILVPR